MPELLWDASALVKRYTLETGRATVDALLARDDKSKDRVLSDLADHSNKFRQYLTKNNELPLNAAIKAQLQETQPVLEEYIKSAEVIVDIAFKNRATAQAQMEAFLVVFNDLDGKLSKLSDNDRDFHDTK